MRCRCLHVKESGYPISRHGRLLCNSVCVEECGSGRDTEELSVSSEAGRVGRGNALRIEPRIGDDVASSRQT